MGATLTDAIAQVLEKYFKERLLLALGIDDSGASAFDVAIIKRTLGGDKGALRELKKLAAREILELLKGRK